MTGQAGINQPRLVGAMSSSVRRRVRDFYNQGEEHLIAIERELRSLLREAEPKSTFATLLLVGVTSGRPMGAAQGWARRVDEYAAARLQQDVVDALTAVPTVVAHGAGMTLLAKAQMNCESVRNGVRKRVEVLEALLGKRPRIAAEFDDDREAAGGWRHLRDVGFIDRSVVDGYLRRMRTRRTRADRASAVGAAKELFEATVRGVLAALSLPSDDDIGVAWRRVCDRLVLDASAAPSLGGKGKGARPLVNGLNTVVQSITEIRNDVGSGHGRPDPAVGLTDGHVVLVVDAVYTLTRFLADRFHLLQTRDGTTSGGRSSFNSLPEPLSVSTDTSAPKGEGGAGHDADAVDA